MYIYTRAVNCAPDDELGRLATRPEPGLVRVYAGGCRSGTGRAGRADDERVRARAWAARVTGERSRTPQGQVASAPRVLCPPRRACARRHGARAARDPWWARAASDHGRTGGWGADVVGECWVHELVGSR